MRFEECAVGGEHDVELLFAQQIEQRVDVFVNKWLATMNTDQRITRRESAHQFDQRFFIHVLDMANAVEEVTVLSPLVAEWTAKIAGFGRDELDHGRDGKLECL